MSDGIDPGAIFAIPAGPAPLPDSLHIGHVTFAVAEDDARITAEAARTRADLAGSVDFGSQQILLATRNEQTRLPNGPDYQRDTLLHEVLHACLRVTGTDPDADAAAGLRDVEERAISAMSGPLLAALRDNPALVAYLTDGVTAALPAHAREASTPGDPR